MRFQKEHLAADTCVHAETLGLFQLPPSTSAPDVRYIKVSDHTDRRLFYILTEAEEDPENAPLILWLNG